MFIEKIIWFEMVNSRAMVAIMDMVYVVMIKDFMVIVDKFW